jgi:hypothetical protein
MWKAGKSNALDSYWLIFAIYFSYNPPPPKHFSCDAANDSIAATPYSRTLFAV